MPGQLPIRLPLRFVLAVFYYLLIRGVLGKHLNLTVKYTSHSCSHIGERGRLLTAIQILAGSASSFTVRHGTAFRAAACLQGLCLHRVKRPWDILRFFVKCYYQCCRNHDTPAAA